MAAGRTLTASEHDWLRVRSYLTGHRHDLAVRAADDHPADARVAGTPPLAAPGWQLPAPVPLGDIGLELGAGNAASPLPARLPVLADGSEPVQAA